MMEKSEQENKYYTPSIEEFHFGFEYEFKEYQFYDQNICGDIWMPREFDFTFGEDNEILDLYEDGSEEGTLRVKYLDEQDIKDLGGVFTKEEDNKLIFSFYGRKLDFNPHTLEVSIWENISPAPESEVYWPRVRKMIIKNKSELKNIIGKIGITQ